jgi:hypothetical protein
MISYSLVDDSRDQGIHLAASVTVIDSVAHSRSEIRWLQLAVERVNCHQSIEQGAHLLEIYRS